MRIYNVLLEILEKDVKDARVLFRLEFSHIVLLVLVGTVTEGGKGDWGEVGVKGIGGCGKGRQGTKCGVW